MKSIKIGTKKEGGLGSKKNERRANMIKASGLNDRGAPRLLTQSGGRAG
jgi:hypothetical protein